MLVDMGRDLVVCMDPGHGGRQPGCSANGLREADVTLWLGKQLEQVLAPMVGLAVLTRTRDIELTLQDRGDIAMRADSDIVLVLHCDTNARPAVGDLSCYYLQGDEVARIISQEIERLAPEDLRPHMAQGTVALPEGWTQRAYNVLHHHAGRHPVLVEAMFLSNPRHVAFLRDPLGLPSLAHSIAAGMLLGARMVLRQKERDHGINPGST